MQNKLTIYFLLLFCAYQSAEAQPKKPTKRALIVAIGNYPDYEKNRWPAISSTNDVPLIKEALEKNNFLRENITVLLDSQATKKGIENALDKLIKSSEPGDIVVIHFSTHGEQLEDNGTDETDHLDETIVPYGATFSTIRSLYPQLESGYFRDDLFGEKMTQLRNSVGSNGVYKGDVLVIMDACHSGTGARGVGDAKVRGGGIPMVSETYGTKSLVVKDEKGVFKEESTTKLTANAATYVLISGAQAQEQNFECRDDKNNPVGSLSYAFSKAIAGLKDSTTTYRSLFALIENIMREKAPKQRPVLEGDGIDRRLFGGEFVKQEQYFKVNPATVKSTVEINGGTVSGITEGSVVSFYKIGTLTPGNTPLNKGTVTSAKNFSATVKLEKPDDSLYKKAWAFVTEMAYGGKKVRVKVNPLDGADKKVQAALKDFQLVEFTKEFDLYLDTAGSGDKWVFKYASSGTPFGTKDSSFSISDTKRMKEILKRYDRFQYLQNLKFEEKGLSAKVELLFLNNKKEIDSAKMALRTKFGRLELQEGDTVYIKVKNTGIQDLYVNVIDIQPDGNINPVLPNKNVLNMKGDPAPITWDQCLVKKNDSLFNTNLFIEVYPPYGEETLKVFLSDKPLDLEDLLTSNNDTRSRSAGVLNNLAKVFKDSKVNEVGTRGIKPKVNTADNGTIFSVNFSIIPETIKTN